ncbi:cation:proton antiporter [Candidatus Lucifugimonas marina]|uniref:Cation:proton antiporter n=1 Tax=Candidatus Lucifugimonas marina TaxID=3038979 RepID=A0AAJ5ZJF3_9CHLR|nr:cation:proton antiporter [SAR202 cluster bacterium JH639]WFG35899.1 cation:proton antiporter [SAR202 cluster bacterium JH545]WFG39842.1 cation:proton antiporter [SAR202 cluster bacterium JH1073]
MRSRDSKLHDSPLAVVAELVLLLSVILVAAKVGGEVSERYLKIPPVLGELGAGILISPFLLGGIHWFGGGALFEVAHDGSGLPVEPQLFFVAQMAAIVLLFEAGLETNREQFMRYVKPATAVAAGGVILPFVMGFAATVMLGFADMDSIQGMIPAMFVGAIMTATSVGITARVLADIRRLDSPEGVTVLAGAVVDDVLGIIILAIVVGIAEEGTVTAGSIGVIFLKAVGFWLGLMIIGSIVSKYISNVILWFKSAGGALVLALALAFIASAVAEIYFGLAMIIGAYTMGLALSSTELKHHVEESMRSVNNFLVPIFFVVIGMQVDFTAFGAGDTSLGSAILFAVVLTIFAVISKIVGSGLPAMFVGFNRIGATRVALGMLPRGEVALIVAGIGLTSGVIGQDIFGVAIVMTVVTTVLAPVFLIPAFKGGSGLKNGADSEVEADE